MRPHLKKQAIALRVKGYSYNMIVDALNVSKSTLHHWLREVPYTPNKEVIKRVNSALLNFVMRSHEKRNKSFAQAEALAKNDVGIVTKRDLFMIGIGLYIGEGTKAYEHTQIVNSDPDVIRLSMKWLQSACSIPLQNIFAAVHLYPDTPRRSALRYWSKITHIPLSRFGKTQIDLRTDKLRKKRRSIPYGTIRITVRACGKEEFGVIMHRRIQAWIKEVYKQTRV